MKPILCLDFDGVIHSYTSRWQGAAVIPDPPVPGALQFIRDALEAFDVQIFSSRSHQWGGKRAMKRWLIQHYTEMYWTVADVEFVSFTHADINDDARAWAEQIVGRIVFPWFKPPAKVTIDDRALTFTGVWPDLAQLDAFKPWNKV